MATRRYIAELIQRRLAAGDPTDDFPIHLEEINGWLNFAIGAAAMKNYADNAGFDVEYVADAFYRTGQDLALTEDASTGYYYTALPAMAYGLPKGWDITGVYPVVDGKVGKPFVRIFLNQLEYFENLRMPPNKTAYWLEGQQLFVKSFAVLDGASVRVRMAGSGGTGLNDDAGIPDDMMDFVVTQVYNKLLPTLNIKPDLSNDGVNVV